MGETRTSLAQPDEALAALCAQIQPLAAERVEWAAAAGRILAEPILLDRPSPACDVSAMDGYALRLADAGRGVLPVSAVVQAGMPATPLATGSAARIFTGAMVPPGAEAIIPREQLIEHSDRIQIPADLRLEPGQHIRRQGENGAAGRTVAEAGQLITPPVLAAIASCGRSTVQVRQRVKLGIIVTGGEVLDVGETPAPWQLRDGNGPALLALFAGVPWIETIGPRHVIDQPALIAGAVSAMLDDCDALLLTGGVSAGDHDHVPAVLRGLGASVVFHKLAIRPGKPVLGAVDRDGRPILGLPGNPVSAMVTSRRFAASALRVRVGLAHAPSPEMVQVADIDRAPKSLTWFPLVRSTAAGRVSIVQGMGSGDWVSAAGSDGFIEVPAGASAAGERPFYRWSIA